MHNSYHIYGSKLVTYPKNYTGYTWYIMRRAIRVPCIYTRAQLERIKAYFPLPHGVPCIEDLRIVNPKKQDVTSRLLRQEPPQLLLHNSNLYQ